MTPSLPTTLGRFIFSSGKIFAIASFLFNCSQTDKKNPIIGLWALEEVKIDKYKEQPKSLFIQFTKDGTLAVAKASGDLSGLYKAGSDQLVISTVKENVYNQKWVLFCHGDILMLKGRTNYSDFAIHKRYGNFGPLNTELKFKRITKIPDYQEIEDRLMGTWDLYKVRKQHEIKKLDGTTFEINSNGSYIMRSIDGTEEQGMMTINTRYRKVYFEKEKTVWDIDFFGQELRLSQPMLNLEYSLRRIKN